MKRRPGDSFALSAESVGGRGRGVGGREGSGNCKLHLFFFLSGRLEAHGRAVDDITDSKTLTFFTQINAAAAPAEETSPALLSKQDELSRKTASNVPPDVPPLPLPPPPAYYPSSSSLIISFISRRRQSLLTLKRICSSSRQRPINLGRTFHRFQSSRLFHLDAAGGGGGGGRRLNMPAGLELDFDHWDEAPGAFFFFSFFLVASSFYHTLSLQAAAAAAAAGRPPLFPAS